MNLKSHGNHMQISHVFICLLKSEICPNGSLFTWCWFFELGGRHLLPQPARDQLYSCNLNRLCRGIEHRPLDPLSGIMADRAAKSHATGSEKLVSQRTPANSADKQHSCYRWTIPPIVCTSPTHELFSSPIINAFGREDNFLDLNASNCWII